MTQAAERHELSLGEAVDRVVELVRERQVPVSDVVDDVLPYVSDDAAPELMRWGLVALGNDKLHKRRNGWVEAPPESDGGPGPSIRRVQQPGAPHPRDRKAWRALLEIMLSTADGERQLPLEELTLEDVDHHVAQYEMMASANARKADFMRLAAEALRKAKKAKIADLPVAERAKLERAAKDAWRNE